MRLRKLLVRALLLCAVLSSVATRSFAQVNTVNLSGTVLDPQNLAVKDAKITVRNPAKGIERTATSEADGRYKFVGLPPGTFPRAERACDRVLSLPVHPRLTNEQVAFVSSAVNEVVGEKQPSAV